MAHDEKKDWEFFRKTARDVLWPHVEQEYRDELTASSKALKARGVKIDIWDMVALNAWLELPYYDKWHAKSHGKTVSVRPSPSIAAPSWPPAATPRTAAW